jgi:hypothetical protein
MRVSKYNDSAIGKVISMRCRRSLNNRDVIVIDNTKLNEVYVYEHEAIDSAISFLQDELNLDIVSTKQTPISYDLLHHDSTGYVYRVIHEEDQAGDDFHAFFAPLEAE